MTFLKDIDPDLFRLIRKAGQEHVLTWWDVLSRDERDGLISQLRSIDFDWLNEVRELVMVAKDASEITDALRPVFPISIPKSEEEIARAVKAKQTGEAFIHSGKLAAFVVAGGQGSRLGYPGPKGEFPIGPVSGKSLFQLFAEKIKAAMKKYEVEIPWVIMTSHTTHEPTQAFFQSHQFFNLNPETCYFVQQAMLPALDEQGNLMLDAKGHLFTNPNGHGGMYSALYSGGVLSELEARGIEVLSYFQVDNPLIRIVDPLFVGYHVQQHSEMSSKMVRKAYPEEKVGVFGSIRNEVKVIEYNHMSEEEMLLRNSDGHLQYDAANVAIHLINLDFVRIVMEKKLRFPCHLAHKIIPFLADSGEWIKPKKPNGYKFESFVFDALPHAKNAAVMEVDRKEEFSPVKNKTGKDSPETAKKAMTAYFGSWLESAGYTLPKKESGEVAIPIEIGPLYADTKEDFLEKIPDRLSFQDSIYLDE